MTLKLLKQKKTKRTQRAGGKYLYSADCQTWVPARDYQNIAADAASKNQSKSYIYNKAGINFTLAPLHLLGMDAFVMIKEDGSIAFLKSESMRASHMSQSKKASSNSKVVKKYKAATAFTATYLGKDITIKKGDYYYGTKPKKALIGWHGSVNPPMDMDGEFMHNIPDTEAISDE